MTGRGYPVLCGEAYRYWKRTVADMRERRRYRNEASGRRCPAGCPCTCHSNARGLPAAHPGLPCPSKNLDQYERNLITLMTPPEIR